MKITADSWHCKLYQWWYRNKYHSESLGHTNLCPYVRSVTFWAPARALFGSWIKLGRMPINALTIPVLLYSIPTLLGNWSYKLKMGIWEVYWVLALLAVVITVEFLLINYFSKRSPRLKKRSDSVRVIQAYLRTAHDGVCPEISWK